MSQAGTTQGPSLKPSAIPSVATSINPSRAISPTLDSDAAHVPDNLIATQSSNLAPPPPRNVQADGPRARSSSTQMTAPDIPITTSALQLSSATTIELHIIRVKMATATYDPVHAEEGIVSRFHEAIDDLLDGPKFDPATMRVVFRKSTAESQHGHFILTFPEILLPLAEEHLIPFGPRGHKPLRYTGDTLGNSYELIFRETKQDNRPVFASTWSKDAITWCHIIPPIGSKSSKRDVFEAATAHLEKFGLYTSQDPKAFLPSMNATKTQWSGKYMCGYDIVPTKIPKHADGTNNLEGIREFVWNNELFKFWHAPKTLTALFQVCERCYRNHMYCQCKRPGDYLENKDKPKRLDDATAAKKRKERAAIPYEF